MKTNFRTNALRLFVLSLTLATANAAYIGRRAPVDGDKPVVDLCTLAEPFKPGEFVSCLGTAKKYGISYAQLVAWNPKLNPTCTNIGGTGGLCVSNPDAAAQGYQFPVNNHKPTPTSGQKPTPAKPLIDHTETVHPMYAPGSLENSSCLVEELASPGDTCDIMVNRAGINLHDFVFLNPQLLHGCPNLIAGYFYCVKPKGDISSYPGYSNGPIPWADAV